ncbi:FLYWCH zinc finger domain-containing protein [Phthorimaea operculella]|nr:FLYWCH zinc finger domain-containing protein [Phthorimaea operculella]
MEGVTFLRNQAGKPVALFEGYTLYQSAQCTRTCNWVCTRAKSCKCKARVVTARDGRVIRKSAGHSHPPQPHTIKKFIWKGCSVVRRLQFNAGFAIQEHVQLVVHAKQKQAVQGALGHHTRRLLLGHPLFTYSRRGTSLMFYRGHRFTLTWEARRPSSKRRWRCSKWYAGCRVGVVTLHDRIHKVVNVHNHL